MKILKTFTDPVSGERLYKVLFSETEDALLLTGGGIGAGALAGREIARKISAKKLKKEFMKNARKNIEARENKIDALAENFKGGKEEARKLAEDITAIQKGTAKKLAGKKDVARKILKKSGRRGALIGAGVGGTIAGGYLLADHLRNSQDNFSLRGGGENKRKIIL